MGQDFTSDDLPGFPQGAIQAGDNIEWKFVAEQYIVDTSDLTGKGGTAKVIAYIPTQRVTITGAHPRTFAPLPTPGAAAILRKRRES